MLILGYRQRQYQKRRCLRIFCFIQIENQVQFHLSQSNSVLRRSTKWKIKNFELYTKNTHYMKTKYDKISAVWFSYLTNQR
jgi:hypothetical protein